MAGTVCARVPTRQTIGAGTVPDSWWPVALQCFHPDGSHVFKRHALSIRSQRSTRERYAKLIEERGLMLGARAEIRVLRTTTGKRLTLEVFAGATMSEALPIAAKRSKDKHFVKQRICKCVANVVEINESCPEDVLTYFVASGNEFNLIASQPSFPDLLAEIWDMMHSYKGTTAGAPYVLCFLA